MTFCKSLKIHFILYYPEEFAYNCTKNNQFQDSVKSAIGRNDKNEASIAKNMTVNGQKIGYVTKISNKLLKVQSY